MWSVGWRLRSWSSETFKSRCVDEGRSFDTHMNEARIQMLQIETLSRNENHAYNADH